MEIYGATLKLPKNPRELSRALIRELLGCKKVPSMELFMALFVPQGAF